MLDSDNLGMSAHSSPLHFTPGPINMRVVHFNLTPLLLSPTR